MTWIISIIKSYPLVSLVVSGGLTASVPFWRPEKIYQLSARKTAIMGIFILIVFVFFFVSLLVGASLVGEYFYKHPL